MPSQSFEEVLAKVARSHIFTPEDGLALIESRREKMTRFLDRCSLKTLDTLALLDSGDGTVHALRDDVPEFVDACDKLQGIFAGNAWVRRRQKESGKREYVAWGLLRSGEWVLVHVVYGVDPWETGGPYVRRERALRVQSRTCDVVELLQETELTHETVLLFLKYSFDEWVSTRRSLLHELEMVMAGMEFEDHLLSFAARVLRT